MTITSLDGYRWLKNDIIRGNFQPDEKLRMSLLTSRYALGVGPLREALSQLVAERLVTVVNQKGYRVASMSEQELLDIFDARANMEAMLVSLAIARGGDEWEADVLAKAHLLSKLEACDASEKMLDEWDCVIRRFIRQLWRAVVLTICCKCVNGCLIWRRVIDLSGCGERCFRWKCWRINTQSAPDPDCGGTGARYRARQ